MKALIRKSAFAALAASFFLFACATSPAAPDRKAQWAQPVPAQHLENLYRIDEGLYRCSQPSPEGFRELERMGVREVLNLRWNWSDEGKAAGTDLTLHRVRMLARKSDTRQFVEALRIIRDRKGPLAIHCIHGSDRTGIVTALYRMAFQDWTREAAIEELRDGGYGYHPIFGNIVTYLETVDIQEFKRELGITSGHSRKS